MGKGYLVKRTEVLVIFAAEKASTEHKARVLKNSKHASSRGARGVGVRIDSLDIPCGSYQ